VRAGAAMSAQLRTRQELKLQKFNNIDCVALDAIGQGYKGIQAYMGKDIKQYMDKVIAIH
jgi:hypothetical protein